MRFNLRCSLLLLISLLLTFPVRAENTVRTEQVQVRLISESESLPAKGTAMLGFYFELAPEWHVYWENPGDSGLPPKIRWTLPEGVSAGPVEWPTPERIRIGHLANYGYSKEVLFMVPMTIDAASTARDGFNLAAKMDWLVCREDCLPQSGNFSLTIPRSAEVRPSPDAALFTAARAKLPRNDSALSLALGEVRPESFDLLLQLPGINSPLNSSVLFFPRQRSLIEAARPQTLTSSQNGWVLTVQKASTFTSMPERISGILRIDSNAEAEGFLIEGETKAVAPGDPASAQTLPLQEQNIMLLLLSAFLGGIILNLMPCVFPILSIKVLGLIGHADHSLRNRLSHAGAFLAGVLVSMWILAGALLLLRNAGEEVGWGFHLQSPMVVTVLSLLFIFIGLYFLGVFHWGNSLSSRASALDQREGLGGSFLSGLLAVVVATPCTAPFMGGAIGVGVLLGPVAALSIFTALGIGMAAPYILLMAFPRLSSFLPRPGAWMERLKEFFAFPMFATALWLLWVLSIQSGGVGVIIVLTAATLLIFASWTYRHFVHPSGTSRLKKAAGSIVALCAILLGLVLIFVPRTLAVSQLQSTGSDGSVTDSHGLTWQKFSPQLITELQSAGRVIYVDYTAAWCLTCQLNKSVVFTSAAVQKAIADRNVALVRADWTNQDPIITESLSTFDRAGVPLNLVYHPGRKENPEVLPTLLTPQIVLEALSH